MLDGICAFLDESVPEVRGDYVHFTATTGSTTMEVCMSRSGARKMASKVIYLLDAADREQARVQEFRRAG